MRRSRWLILIICKIHWNITKKYATGLAVLNLQKLSKQLDDLQEALTGLGRLFFPRKNDSLKALCDAVRVNEILLKSATPAPIPVKTPEGARSQTIPKALISVSEKIKSRSFASQRKWVSSLLTSILSCIERKKYPRDVLLYLSPDLTDPLKDCDSQPISIWKHEKISKENLLFVPSSAFKCTDIDVDTYLQQLGALIIGTVLTKTIPFTNGKASLWRWSEWSPAQSDRYDKKLFTTRLEALAKGVGACGSALHLLETLWKAFPPKILLSSLTLSRISRSSHNSAGPLSRSFWSTMRARWR